MSSCVGHDFWQGASAHLRQRLASLSAALSLSVVCLTSSKFLSLLAHVWSDRVQIRRTYAGLQLTIDKRKVHDCTSCIVSMVQKLYDTHEKNIYNGYIYTVFILE